MWTMSKGAVRALHSFYMHTALFGESACAMALRSTHRLIHRLDDLKSHSCLAREDKYPSTVRTPREESQRSEFALQRYLFAHSLRTQVGRRIGPTLSR